jgi:hypothetical protein
LTYYTSKKKQKIKGAYSMSNRIVSVRKNSEGDIVELKLSSGHIVDYKQAQQMAKTGDIEHVNVFIGKDGEEHLRSDADGIKENNLDQLPTF